MVVVVLVRVLANDTYVVRHVDRGALVGEVLDHGIVARERVRMKSCDTALLDNDNDMMKRKCRRRRRQWIVCVQLSGSRRNSWYACEYSVGRSRLIVRVIASLWAVVVVVVVVVGRTYGCLAVDVREHLLERSPERVAGLFDAATLGSYLLWGILVLHLCGSMGGGGASVVGGGGGGVGVGSGDKERVLGLLCG